jgi:hypothetical protein
MKKGIQISVVLMVIFGFVMSASATPHWWYAHAVTVVSVESGANGVQLQITWDGTTAKPRYWVDPSANYINQILAIALTAASNNQLVNVEFDGSTITGIRFAD